MACRKCEEMRAKLKELTKISNYRESPMERFMRETDPRFVEGDEETVKNVSPWKAEDQ